jgi:hypothetical protein
MQCIYVVESRLAGLHTNEEEIAFHNADTRFRAGLLASLGDTIVDTCVVTDWKRNAWDALEARYKVNDAGSELYVMEQFHDYRMVRTVRQQWNRVMQYKH